MSSNQHIVDYLDYYCALPKTPGFAVMIDGAWGSGKTRFLRDYMDENKNLQFAVVSLFGLASLSEIEDALFASLHPFLGSKTVGILCKVGKGLLKATLRVDWEGEGKGGIQGSIPADFRREDLPSWLTNADKHIIMFDDFERCRVKPDMLLGFINSIVEHAPNKVIVIANEAEIKKSDLYRRVKEKVIGHTFRLSPNAPGVIPSLVNEIEDETVREFVRGNQQSVIRVFEMSKYSNFRSIQIAFAEFSRFYKVLPPIIICNKEFLVELFQVYLALTIETRSNSNAIEELKVMQGGHNFFRQSQEEGTLEFELSNKYRVLPDEGLLLTGPTWLQILCENVFEISKITSEIMATSHFRSATDPLWVRLWHCWKLDDDALRLCIEEVESELKGQSVTKAEEIKHIYATLFELGDNGIYKNKVDLLKEAHEYVQGLRDGGLLVASDDRRPQAFKSTGYGGYGYHGVDTPEFRELSEVVDTASLATRERKYPEMAAHWLSELTNENRKPEREIFTSVDHNGAYADIPIFEHIKASEFCAIYFALPFARRNSIAASFACRYKYAHDLDAIRAESKFIDELIPIFQAESETRKGKISGLQLRRDIEFTLQASLDVLLPQKPQ